eukprot:7072874-Pyramimonas_sp.AAC.1
MLYSLGSQAPLFCLLDANATVGTVQSSHVGPVDAEQENDTGHLFHDFLRATGQSAASTFSEPFHGMH